DPGDEHGFTQFHARDPERPEPATQGSQTRLEVRRTLRKIPVFQRFAGRLVGVENPPVPIEYDDAFAEPVEDRLGQRGEDAGELIERDSLCHARRYGLSE